MKLLAPSLAVCARFVAVAIVAVAGLALPSRAQVLGGSTTPVDSSILPITEPIEVGPVLDVIPVVSADGYTIQMTIIPTLKEFLGYDDPGQFSAIVQSAGGQNAAAPIISPTPLPKFRLRQVATQAIVWDGQTVVLGGLIAEDVLKTKDKVPFLGDLPLHGRLFRSEANSTKKKNLVIFVTPTIIDPAGNPAHSPEEMPFAQANIPPQTTAGTGAAPFPPAVTPGAAVPAPAAR